MFNTYRPCFLLIICTLFSGLALAHPLTMGRLNVENESNTIKTKLEIDFHSCEHLVDGKCALDEKMSKKLFMNSLGKSPMKFNGEACKWAEDYVAKKLSRELIELSASAACSEIKPQGELALDLSFLKHLGKKYQLMTKSKLLGVERVQSATATESTLILKTPVSKVDDENTL